jgi:sugar fermentation stimulation protein A
MKFPDLTPAVFIKRPNRFVAEVRIENGEMSKAHVPTTGRLTNALEPGCRVWLARGTNPNRKTPYTLILSELLQGGYCSVQATLANRLFAEAVAAGKLSAFPYDRVAPEVTVGASRLDFRLANQHETCWVEIKSVTYAADGVGKFPDAPTGRGRKHLNELANLKASGDRASVVFIAQREDVQTFNPFEEVDPQFTDALRQVHRQGVDVHAYRCKVSIHSISISNVLKSKL